MANTEEVGFGIIGLGGIGPTHAKAIEKVVGAELIAVADVKQEALDAFYEGYDYDVESYLDYREMLEREDIQAVCICVPSGRRRKIAEDCARAGKHILCEKPLEITTQRADMIIKAADEAGVKLACVFQSRFARAFQLLKEAVQQGLFGKLILVSADIRWYRKPKYYTDVPWHGTKEIDGGGTMMNQSIHMIDILLWLMGKPEWVRAITQTAWHDIEAEDLAVAHVIFASGVIGTIAGSTAIYPGHPARIQIGGTDGSVIIEDGEIVFCKFRESSPISRQMEEEMGRDSGLGSGAGDPFADLDIGGHVAAINDLVFAFRNDCEPAVPGREGRRAIELIEAVYESAETGNPVVFDK